jgi:hypothetical protein
MDSDPAIDALALLSADGSRLLFQSTGLAITTFGSSSQQRKGVSGRYQPGRSTMAGSGVDDSKVA